MRDGKVMVSVACAPDEASHTAAKPTDNTAVATVPAVLKALYDRCQPYWARHYVLGLPVPPKRPGALLLAHAGGDPYGSEAAVITTKSVFAVVGLSYTASYEIVGVDSPSDIGRHPEAFEKVAEVGRRLVSEALGDPSE